MRIGIVGCICCYLCISFAGCSHITVLRVKELTAVKAHVDSLSVSLTASQKEILSMQKDNQELLRLLRADQQLRFAELDRQVSSLAGNVVESQQRLTQIDKKTEEIKQSWEEKARSDSMAVAQKNAEGEKLFSLAKDDFMAGRFDLSINGFQDLRRRFPESSLADDALYGISECLNAQQKIDTAEISYKLYLKEYPEGRNICLALYKLGTIFDKQKKEKAKEMVWRKLIERCKDSQEAQIVVKQMPKLMPKAGD